MARGKMDHEMLALSRASKHIEDLEDPRAQCRVATYLMMRYTSAGEQSLPSEERAKHSPFYQEPVDPRQMQIPGTEASPSATTRPATAVDVPPATVTPSVSSTAVEPPTTGHDDTSPGPDMRDMPPPVKTGWGLSGEDGNDDEGGNRVTVEKQTSRFKKLATDTPKPLKKDRTLKESAGGWELVGGDEEVEVKI